MVTLLASVGSTFVLRTTALLQRVVERDTLDTIAVVASIATTLALLLLALVAARVLWSFRSTHTKVNALIERLQSDVAPLIRHANAIADNVNFLTTSIRSDIQKVNNTIDSANDRVKRALTQAERRLNEFNALMAVVQSEAEGVFVSTASTVRGVRRGAASFSARSGTDLASEELDAAELAEDLELESLDGLEGDDLDIQEEEDGDDRDPESAAQALPAAPRVRPRAGSRRRA
jgi:uncharacterized protein YoxC